MFIVTLTYLKPVEEIDALMPGHVAWLDKGYADGLFLASGRRIPRTGGVILARSGSEAALADYLGCDPFAIHGSCASRLASRVSNSGPERTGYLSSAR
jgi:uncharacterized protein YciI